MMLAPRASKIYRLDVPLVVTSSGFVILGIGCCLVSSWPAAPRRVAFTGQHGCSVKLSHSMSVSSWVFLDGHSTESNSSSV